MSIVLFLANPTSPSPIRQSQQASFNNNKERSDVVFMVEIESLTSNANIEVVLSQRKSDYLAASPTCERTLRGLPNFLAAPKQHFCSHWTICVWITLLIFFLPMMSILNFTKYRSSLSQA
jgi:hypothetical protein